MIKFFHDYARTLLADSNVHRATIKQLEYSGFRVIANVARLETKSRSDEDLHESAIEHGQLIVTHDYDFLHPTRFDHAKSFGVVIFPTPIKEGVACKPDSFPPLEAAVDHFTNFITREVCGWLYYKVALYTSEGNLFIFPNKPLGRNRKNNYPPEVPKLRFM